MKFAQIRPVIFGFWLTLAGFATPAPALINGAGSSFINPILTKWVADYQTKKPGTQINYQSTGSGAGVRQFLEKTVDFAATDAPMTDEQMKKQMAAGEPVVHVPMILGAVVVTYNVDGVPTGLKLKGTTVADIFSGKITKWNDSQIAKLNPGTKLPDTAILVVHRSDGSGTTNIFTDFLAKASPEWKAGPGVGTTVKWPVGLGGKGNEGVAGTVKQTPGSIGYVELIYAENNSLPFATVENPKGEFVKPTLAAVTAAAAGVAKNVPADFRFSLTNTDGKGAYPISGVTYILVWRKGSTEKGKDLISFLDWALTDGQGYAEGLKYAPLPKPLAEKAKKELAQVKLTP